MKKIQARTEERSQFPVSIRTFGPVDEATARAIAELMFDDEDRALEETIVCYLMGDFEERGLRNDVDCMAESQDLRMREAAKEMRKEIPSADEEGGA